MGLTIRAVAVYQQHMLVSEWEEIGTRAIFDLVRPATVRFVERSEVFPVNQVVRPEQAGAVALV